MQTRFYAFESGRRRGSKLGCFHDGAIPTAFYAFGKRNPIVCPAIQAPHLLSSSQCPGPLQGSRASYARLEKLRSDLSHVSLLHFTFGSTWQESYRKLSAPVGLITRDSYMVSMHFSRLVALLRWTKGIRAVCSDVTRCGMLCINLCRITNTGRYAYSS
jgi:hypothetical protein